MEVASAAPITAAAAESLGSGGVREWGGPGRRRGRGYPEGCGAALTPRLRCLRLGGRRGRGVVMDGRCWGNASAEGGFGGGGFTLLFMGEMGKKERNRCYDLMPNWEKILLR